MFLAQGNTTTGVATHSPIYSWVNWSNASKVSCSRKQQQTAVSGIYEGVYRENGWRAIDGSMVHDAMEDVEGEFEGYPARSVPTFLARVRFRFRNT